MAIPDERTGSRASPPRGSGRSAANPQKLKDYASTGAEMLSILRAKQSVLHGALEALRPHASSEYVPSLEAIDRQLDTLIADWEHLDTFVGDVGQAFADASQSDNDNSVLSFTDVRLAQAAHVGYANRQEAIDAAQAAAEELAELRGRLTDYGITSDELEAVVEQIERGQYDPAFAVAFSEATGAEGYVEAMAVIRSAYLGDVPAEGLAAVQVLGTTLTTALDTLPSIPSEQRRDPDNAQLSPDQHLSGSFKDDLLDLDLERGDAFDYGPSEQDLSVLMSYTDPPTNTAVELANQHLTPYLDNVSPWEETAHMQQWGSEHGDVVTNYATMLSRNADASTSWLTLSPGSDTTNIELVLQRNGDADADGGEALAGVVEQGLTNPNQAGNRQDLMELAIETIGEQDEIRNPHMEEALATGVEHNMDVIDSVVNGDWEGVAGEGTGRGVYQTHDFLREVMRDEAAASQVREATYRYVENGMLTLSPDETRDLEVEKNGRLLGLVTQADANAAIGEIEARIESQENAADAVNYGLGLVPYVGQATSAAEMVVDGGVGGLIFSPGNEIDEARLELRPMINRLDRNLASYAAVASYESGVWESEEVVAAAGVDFFEGRPGDTDRRIKPLHEMTDAELAAYNDWVLSPDVAAAGGGAGDDYAHMVTGAFNTLAPLLLRT